MSKKKNPYETFCPYRKLLFKLIFRCLFFQRWYDFFETGDFSTSLFTTLDWAFLVKRTFKGITSATATDYTEYP